MGPTDGLNGKYGKKGRNGTIPRNGEIDRMGCRGIRLFGGQILGVRRLLPILLVVFLSAGALVIYICFFFGNGYVWDRDINNQELIGKAYVKFYLSSNRYPSSLQELVQAGYLPRKASFYVEPPDTWNSPADAASSCYVVQPPPSGSVEDLHMIARRSVEGNKLRFEPVANASIRDDIIKQQVPRDSVAYSNYIAPLEIERASRAGTGSK